MIELPLSVVAWISVVLVQAIIHFVVLGRRRGRVQVTGEDDDAALEESLSLATAETSDEGDVSFTMSDCGYQGSVIPSSIPGTPTLLGEKELITLDTAEMLEMLGQTGTELLKSRSVESMVEEQMRAIAQ